MQTSLIRCPRILLESSSCVLIPTHELLVFSDAGNIYVFGGWRKSPGNTKMLDSAFKFDNRRNRWVELAPLPGKRWASACAVTQVPSEFLGAESAPTDSVNHGGLQPMESSNDRMPPDEEE